MLTFANLKRGDWFKFVRADCEHCGTVFDDPGVFQKTDMCSGAYYDPSLRDTVSVMVGQCCASMPVSLKGTSKSVNDGDSSEYRDAVGLLGSWEGPPQGRGRLERLAAFGTDSEAWARILEDADIGSFEDADGRIAEQRVSDIEQTKEALEQGGPLPPPPPAPPPKSKTQAIPKESEKDLGETGKTFCEWRLSLGIVRVEWPTTMSPQDCDEVKNVFCMIHRRMSAQEED